MKREAQADGDLFGGAPFLRLFRRCGLLRPQVSNLARRALIAVLIAWIPLAVLSMAEGALLSSPDAESFLPDLGVHARFLIALPMLVAAESLLASRLGAIVQHFLEVGIVGEADRASFDAALISTKKLVNSLPAELMTIALGYALIVTLMASAPLEKLPAWHLSQEGFRGLSGAGLWHAFVSLPLLFIAVLGVLWRWCLWVRLLWRIAKMSLDLVPAHPDGVAGLRFVSYSVRAYVLHGFLLGVIVAGSMANQVIYEHRSVLAYGHTIGGLLLIVVVLFSAPMLVFTRTLLAAWRRGADEYDALADRLGRQFEARWCGRGDSIDADALGRPDFSATTDLYSVVANVYQMRLFLFDLQGILLLAGATAAPFIPVILFAVPIDAILARAADMLL